RSGALGGRGRGPAVQHEAGLAVPLLPAARPGRREPRVGGTGGRRAERSRAPHPAASGPVRRHALAQHLQEGRQDLPELRRDRARVDEGHDGCPGRGAPRPAEHDPRVDPEDARDPTAGHAPTALHPARAGLAHARRWHGGDQERRADDRVPDHRQQAGRRGHRGHHQAGAARRPGRSEERQVRADRGRAREGGAEVIRFSFVNFATAATIAGSTTFADAIHPATNALLFGRPFLRAYRAALLGGGITGDLGSATALGVIALINANFASATIQGNAADAWGAPSYSQAVTLARSGNERYQHKHIPPVAFNYRYLSLIIRAQASTDGATVFKVATPWAGALTNPPRDIFWSPKESKLEAREDLKTADGRQMTPLLIDDPTWRISAKRLAETGADLAAWREIDRQWSAAAGQAALVLLRDSYTEETWVMRQTSVSAWEHARVWMESDLEMLEVTAG